MNRLLNTLKSGTAIAMCLTIVLEPTSRAWASGNGQSMPGLNDKDEESKVVIRQKNSSKEKEKEKGGEEPEERSVQTEKVKDALWQTQTKCLWHLGTPAYQKIALDILVEEAAAGDGRARIRYLKKLSSLGTIGDFLCEKKKLFLPAHLRDNLDIPEEEMRKNFLSFLSNLYGNVFSSKDKEKLLPKDRFYLLKAKYYYQKLLGPVDPLKKSLIEEIKEGINYLTFSPENKSEVLRLRKAYLEFLISNNLKESNEVSDLEQIFALAKAAEEAANISKVEPETDELRKFAATLYRKAASFLTLSSPSAGPMKINSRQISYYSAAERLGDPIASYRLGLLYGDLKSVDNNDLKKAEIAFGKAAKKGYVLAEYKMATLAASSLEGHEKKGLGFSREWHQLAATQGHPKSMFKLFQYHWTTEGESKDMALAYLIKSAKLGYSKAQRKLAHLHWIGEEVEQNYEESLRWYEWAASQDDSKSHFYLGLAAEKGLGRDIDPDDALKEYDLVKESVNKAKVQLRRGRIYEKGKNGGTSDKETALGHYNTTLELYKKRADTKNSEIASHRRAKAAFYAGRLLLEKEETKGEAYPLIEQGASADLPKACLLLGAMHQYGWGAEQDHEKATSFYNKVIQNSRAKEPIKATSLYQLAWMHKRGMGVSQNNDEALAFFQQAADLGHQESLFQVGKIHFRKKDYLPALRAFETDTLAHHREALYNTAKLYTELGQEEKSFKKIAEKAYRRAAYSGHPIAQYRLGELLEAEGNEEAISWYEIAIEQEYAPAFRSLAKLYLEGKLIEQDIKRSELLFLKSLSKDLEYTQDRIRHLINYIHCGGAESFEELEQEANAHNPYARKHLARLLIEEIHPAHDIGAGIELYAASFKKGISSSLSRIYDLACLGFQPALECLKNARYPSSREEYHRKATDQESSYVLESPEEKSRFKDEIADSFKRLGLTFYHGKNVNKNEKKALELFSLAAHQGNAQAQFSLGVMYTKGEGVPRDYCEAVKWYRLAADQELAEAQFNLGVMYANGDGVLKDDGEAVKWYRLAADQGLAEAKSNLETLLANGEGILGVPEKL